MAMCGTHTSMFLLAAVFLPGGMSCAALNPSLECPDDADSAAFLQAASYSTVAEYPECGKEFPVLSDLMTGTGSLQ